MQLAGRATVIPSWLTLPVIVGGIVPARDEKLLLDAGVARVFHPGTSLEDIAAEIRTLSARSRAMREKEMP